MTRIIFQNHNNPDKTSSEFINICDTYSTHYCAFTATAKVCVCFVSP